MQSKHRAPVLAIAGLVALSVAACGSARSGAPIAGSSSTPTGSSATSPSAAASQAPDPDPLTHHLLAEDFARDGGAFATGQTSDYVFTVEGGTYRVTSGGTSGNPAMTYGEYARTAYAVDASVDVVDADGLPPSTWLGIGCVDDAAADGYLLLVPAGGSGATVRAWTDGRFGDAVLTSGTDYGPVTSLRLSTYIASPTDDAAIVSAWVNGARVPGPDAGDGFNGCAGMVLMVDTAKKGVEVQFDNALATVPGE